MDKPLFFVFIFAVLLTISVAFRAGWGIMHQHIKLCCNRSNYFWDIVKLSFFSWQPDSILDVFGPPTERSTWWSLSLCKIKFGCNRCSNFDNMKVLISVCLFVCLLAYLRNRTAELHQILCTLPAVLGSFLLRRHCDTLDLCISGFVDDVMFSDTIMVF